MSGAGVAKDPRTEFRCAASCSVSSPCVNLGECLSGAVGQGSCSTTGTFFPTGGMASHGKGIQNALLRFVGVLLPGFFI